MIMEHCCHQGGRRNILPRLCFYGDTYRKWLSNRGFRWGCSWAPWWGTVNWAHPHCRTHNGIEYLAFRLFSWFSAFTDQVPSRASGVYRRQFSLKRAGNLADDIGRPWVLCEGGREVRESSFTRFKKRWRWNGPLKKSRGCSSGVPSVNSGFTQDSHIWVISLIYLTTHFSSVNWEDEVLQGQLSPFIFSPDKLMRPNLISNTFAGWL